jgi:hypothetical protein
MNDSLPDFTTLNAVLIDVAQVASRVNYGTLLNEFQQAIATTEAAGSSGEMPLPGETLGPGKGTRVWRNGDDRILCTTGRLLDSLACVGGQGNVHQISPRKLLFGTSIEDARSPRVPASQVPQQEDFGLSEQALQHLANRVADLTVEHMKQDS